MTTERDVYEIDTSLTVKNLQAMYDSQLRIEEMMRGKLTPAAEDAEEGFGKFGAGAVALGTILADLAKQALAAVWEQLKSGVTAAAEAERAYKQLALVAGDYTEALDSQAEALEKQTGASGESLKAVAAMLLRFGVAPADIDKTTRALLDYATATGKDVLDATRQVTMAVENGGSKIESLGIEFEGTGKAAKDMAIAVEGLSKKFGGATEAEHDTLVGRAKRAEVAFDDVKKAFGGMVIEFEDKFQVLDTLTLALNGLNQALFGSADEEHWRQLNQLTSEQLEHANEVARIRKEIADAEASGRTENLKLLKFELATEEIALEDMQDKIRKLQGWTSGINAPGAKKPLDGTDRLTKEGQERAKKAAEEAEKERERELKAHEDAMNKSVEIEKRRHAYEKEFKAEAEKIAKEKEEREQKRLHALAELRKQAFEIEKAEMEVQNERLMAIERERVQAMQESWGKVSDFARDSANKVVDYFAQSLVSFLTTNQTVSAQIQDAQIKRRQAELAEQGVVRTTAELRVEAENERKAAEQQRLADTLANIAVEAGKNALFQSAEAVAAAAGLPATAGKMAAHIAAAAAFATIAGGAGAAAYGIAQSRGATASEREQIEARSRNDKKQKEADDKPIEQGKGPGTQVNVYYLGISGITEAEQGRELERIQSQYSDMKTGGR